MKPILPEVGGSGVGVSARLCFILAGKYTNEGRVKQDENKRNKDVNFHVSTVKINIASQDPSFVNPQNDQTDRR